MTTDPQHVSPQTGERMSIKEYFTLDYTTHDAKYEYHNGTIRLMAGGSKEHDDIAFNIRAALKQEFRSGPCSVQGSDMRVQVNNDTYFYPDVTVTCDVADRRRGNKLIRSPRLVVEVLSPSTEKADREEKLPSYKACPSVVEIAFVSQFAPYIEIWRRDHEDEWRCTHYGSGETIDFASLDVHIPMDDIYDGINFDEPLVEE
ncbi:MAG TPA: Uma2 family endonuclease [Ktedonobacteraceae bacterium]|nr:Uma2 family endonuclease [Ktedonobacteraceae bacterium]